MISPCRSMRVCCRMWMSIDGDFLDGFLWFWFELLYGFVMGSYDT